MTTLFILVRVCILGCRCSQIGGSWSAHRAPLSFALYIVAKSLCFCLCFFVAIIELHAINATLFNDFLIRKVNVDFICKKYI